MDEHQLGQSALQRAWEDTSRFRHSLWFFWSVELGLTLAGGVVGAQFIPEGADILRSAVFPAIGAIAGVLMGFGVFFLFFLMLAPYRQRNEARAELRAIPGATSDAPRMAQPSLFIRQEDCELGVSGEGDYSGLSAKVGTPIVRIGIGFSSAGPMLIESIVLELTDKRIASLGWRATDIDQGYLLYTTEHFEVPTETSPGEHKVRLVAFANNTWWASEPFTITFPAPPSQSVPGSNAP